VCDGEKKEESKMGKKKKVLPPTIENLFFFMIR
jgi:hypothetical protein